MKLTNWQRESSRRKVITLMRSSARASSVSWPKATVAADTAPASAPMIVSPSSFRVSSIGDTRSALDRAGAADLLLQQHHAIEQRLGRGRTAGHVNVDRHDTVASTHDRIGIVIVAAAIGAGAHGDHVARLLSLFLFGRAWMRPY